MPDLLPTVHGTAAAVVRRLSKVRGERIIHADGRTFHGRLEVTGDAGTGVALFDRPGRYDLLVRLSRGIGLPAGWPDALGMAVRILDAHAAGAHQDLLLDTGAAPPLLRRVPLLRREILRSTYSTLLPVDLAGHRFLVGALPVKGAPAVRAVGEVPEGAGFRLCLATAHGRWQELGRLELTGVADDGLAVRFSPFTTGGGIRPAGWLQELRRSSYEAAHVERASLDGDARLRRPRP